jgi:HTH-type transcriptional regulator/antitoxin MqsA
MKTGAVEKAKALRDLPAPQLRRAIRVNARLSEDDVARELSVHRATVCRWELGQRSPRGHLLLAYLDLLRKLQAL